MYIAQYSDKLCEIHLDYFGREYRRSCELFTKDGTIVADFGAGTITLPDASVINCQEEVNQRYVREINAFLDIFEGRAKNINSPDKANKVLALALGKEI